MKHKISKLVFCVAALALAATSAIFPTASASAEERTRVYNFGVSPIVQYIDLKPGKTYTGSFLALNNNDVYQLTGEDFNQPDYETSNRYTQIADWITFAKTTGKIPANSETEVKYRVDVPKNASADGQYAVLMVETIPDLDNSPEGSSITPTYDVGMLIYASVDGETNECGKILSNTTNTFVFEPIITASSTVENCGNVHTDAKHILQVYPLFSDEEVYTNEEDPEVITILPETRRFITSTWQNAPAFGIFKVKHTVTIFGETSTIEKIVLICPIWLTIIFIALLIAIIFWAASNRRQRKAAQANRLATSGVRTDKDKKNEKNKD